MPSAVSARVYLRAMEYSDLDFLNRMHNDEDINRNTAGNKFFVSSEYDRKWLENKMMDNQKQIYLMVCLKETNQAIGYTSLSDIDHWNKKIFLSGYTISSEFTGKGYATEGAKLTIQYAFEELGMNRIEGRFLDDNIASQRVGDKLGYVRDGVLRDYVFKNGRYHDVIFSSILRSDYEKLKEQGIYPIK
ncbi:MAG: GNAT family N-acetyltransferase [Clostridiales bacterium]|nr:GNAT family N-acetyltransferase [Clostridiales bacterium]